MNIDLQDKITEMTLYINLYHALKNNNTHQENTKNVIKKYY